MFEKIFVGLDNNLNLKICPPIETNLISIDEKKLKNFNDIFESEKFSNFSNWLQTS